MIQNKHRAWIAPKARPQPKASGSRVKKEFIEVKPQKGSHDGEPDRFGTLRCWRPGRDSRSSSRECSDSDQRSKEHFVRLNRPRADNIRNSGAYKRGCAGTSIGATTGRKAWNRLLHEEKARGAGEREVHVPGPSVVATFEQRRVVGHGCLHFWIGSSRSSSPDLDRREFTASRNSQKDPKANPILAANEGEGQTGGTPTPTGPPPGWQDPVGDRPEETASPAVAKPKEPASPVSVDPEKILAVIAQTGIPEPKTPPIPGPKTPPTPTTRPKAKSRPLTEEQKAVADEVLAQKARDLLKAAERGTGTLKEEKVSTASGSGAKRVPKYLAHLTDEEREKLFRSELASERQAGAIEWEKELNRQAKEEEERRKAKVLYRSERMAQALEHGKEVQRRRQEEFEKGKQDLLQWRAEEEDRENLRKARRISLEQPAVPPTAGGV